MVLPSHPVSSHTAVYSQQVVWLMSVPKCQESRSPPRYPHLGAERVAQNAQHGISEIMSIPLHRCESPLSALFTLTLQLTAVHLAFPESRRQHRHPYLNKSHVLNAHRVLKQSFPAACLDLNLLLAKVNAIFSMRPLEKLRIWFWF